MMRCSPFSIPMTGRWRDIKRNGAEGQLAQMQAQEDALGITTGEVAGTAVPRAGDDGLIPLAGPPRGYGDDPNLRLTQLPKQW